MIIKTKEFQDACKTILPALDNFTTLLELQTRNNFLYLNVTNKEYFVSIKYPVGEDESLKAVVNAQLFLNLISGITTDEFSISLKDNYITVKAGKSNYKLPLIYENDKLAELKPIFIQNKTVEMNIPADILKSILTVNSKELLKLNKNLVDINELQKLYYITETGCFTFTNGATLNAFTLEKPIKILVNDRVVKLFKLFKEDALFSLGHDQLPNGIIQTKITLETSNIYLAVIITNDEVLINKIQGPYKAAKGYIEEVYTNKVVLSSNILGAAIARLLLFTKNSIDKINVLNINATIEIANNEFIITDSMGNTETLPIESGSFTEDSYKMNLNLYDLKLILDSCKDTYITLNCGNHRSVVINRDNISNLIQER